MINCSVQLLLLLSVFVYLSLFYYRLLQLRLWLDPKVLQRNSGNWWSRCNCNK